MTQLCNCEPGKCYASPGGMQLGKISVISDMACKACVPAMPAPALTAPALLDAAAKHMRDRATTYDKPEGERSMGRTVAMFNAATGRDLSESEGWLLMGCLKIIRDLSRPEAHQDSVEDSIAYAALRGEARMAGR